MAQAFRRIACCCAFALLPALGYAQGPLTSQSPSWQQLGPNDKEVLAPLAGEWDTFDARRKQKWLGIAHRYPALPPDQQERVRVQMQTWVQLTPEQRKVARERYKSIQQLPPDQQRQLREKWERYQSLPPEQKQQLAQPSPHRGPTPRLDTPPATSIPSR